MSRFHFSRCFKASFGQTPHAYRTTLRIERARHLLIVSDRSVTELCMALGFSSVSSFSLLFARHVGMSATVYRRQLRAMAASPRRFPAELVPMCFASRYCPAPR
ncbi:MAG: AraC family transcriptional regulator [Rhodocyclaceae bacterium]|nr:AraC family transcriptional regulator [Rhodocyclaceae bacterium]